ncbi:hypothetical protein AJ88_47370 [Mesorhizobium amorphae CCBAU 01583]|nr:hypothetical protein AJ88_47370 [Mesorhizobium amorphae CCBAU 01583]
MAVSARRTRCTGSTGCNRARRHRQQPFALGALAGQLAGAAHGLGLFTGALLRRLLVMSGIFISRKMPSRCIFFFSARSA